MEIGWLGAIYLTSVSCWPVGMPVTPDRSGAESLRPWRSLRWKIVLERCEGAWKVRHRGNFNHGFHGWARIADEPFGVLAATSRRKARRENPRRI